MILLFATEGGGARFRLPHVAEFLASLLGSGRRTVTATTCRCVVRFGATNFSGTFDNGLGTSGNLAITLPVSSLPIDLNTNLVAEPGMQMVVVDFPGASTIPVVRNNSRQRYAALRRLQTRAD